MINNEKLKEKLSNRPNDIVTIYNDKILEVFNIFSKRINSDNITNEEMVNYIHFLTELYRVENESLGITFHDKRGKRYMNFLMSQPVDTVRHSTMDGYINQQAHYAIQNITSRFYNNKKNFNYNLLEDFPIRELTIINTLFTSEKSKEILKRNYLGYDYYSYKYCNVNDREYCQAVLELFKEIIIRTYNYNKYISGPDYKDSTDEDVEKLYERLSMNCSKDKEYANKGPIGKTLKRIKYFIDSYQED